MKIFRFLAPLLFAGLASGSVAQNQPVLPPGHQTSDDVVQTGADKSMRMTVPVLINGEGPFNFIIDTGSDRTVISTELADRLRLPSSTKARVHAMSGAADVRMVKINSVQVATNKIRHVKAPALSKANLGADGLLGVDSLENLRVSLDFLTGQMYVAPSSAPEAPRPADAGDTIVVTARTRLGQLVMVDADANNERLWVVVDTGAQNSIGNFQMRRMLLRQQKMQTLQPVTMIDVLGRSTTADYTLVKSLRIGGVNIGNAAVAFVDAHPFSLFGLKKRPAMMLGMESLRAFRMVTIDFSKRKITFILPRA